MILGAFWSSPSACYREAPLVERRVHEACSLGRRLSTPLGPLWSWQEGPTTETQSFETATPKTGAGSFIDGYVVGDSRQIVSPASCGGSFNHIIWELDPDCVRIIGDRLGFRCLYYWTPPDRTKLVVASRLELLKRAVPDLQPDPQAFAEQMLLSSVIGDKGLLKGVRRLAPGEVLEISQCGARSSDGSDGLSWGNYHSGLTVDDAARLVLETASEVVTESAGSAALTISLSGGLDSRFLLLLALESCRGHSSAITLGSSGWIDARLAGGVCARSEVPLVRVTPPRQISVGQYVSTVKSLEHVSDYMSPFWLHKYGCALARAANTVFNGFLGGPLTGGALRWCTETASDWNSITENWYKYVNKCNMPRRWVQRIIRLDVIGIERAMVAHLTRLDPATDRSFQQAQFLEMRVRQTGFVSLGTYNLFRNWCKVRVPFTDRRMVELFTNLGIDCLQDQRAYTHALCQIDKTGVPVASTSSRLLNPSTYTQGPRRCVDQGFTRLSHQFQEYIRAHEDILTDCWDVGEIVRLFEVAETRGGEYVKAALIAFNAAALWMALGSE